MFQLLCYFKYNNEYLYGPDGERSFSESSIEVKVLRYLFRSWPGIYTFAYASIVIVE